MQWLNDCYFVDIPEQNMFLYWKLIESEYMIWYTELYTVTRNNYSGECTWKKISPQ